MNSKIFRAYDIRGKYPSEINEETVAEITRSLGRYFISKFKVQSSKFKVLVSYDARLSSQALYKAAIKGLNYSNILKNMRIVPIGLATTPMFYFLVNKLKADAGIMITASHNPKNYNGLKVAGKNAVPISGKEILKLI